MFEDYEKRLLADFLGENWSQFKEFAEEYGYEESDVDAIFNKLEGQ